SQTEPKKYYWRKADHSKCQNGRFAANAWSDWKEITCAVNPYQDMVRPVIFRSRLCLLWIEEQIQKDVKDSEKSAPAYILKLSHIKYDGSWASPFSYNVTNDFVTMKEGRKGLYCAENPGKSALTVACYLVKDSYKVSQKESEQGDNNKGQEKTEYFGRYIFSDMSVENTPDIRNILRYTAPQLDTTTITRVNSLLLHSYSSTLTPENQTGTSNADIELNTQNYYLSQTEDKTYLVFGTDVNVYIHTDFVPLLLRPKFIENMPGNAGVYRTEGTVYTPRNDCPGGECTFSVIKHRHGNSNTIYLSIPGDNKTLQYVNKIILFASNTHGTDVLGQCIHLGSDKDRHYFTCNIRDSMSDYPADETYFTLSVENSSIKKLGEIRYSKIKEYLAYTNIYRCSLEYSHSNETIGKSTALGLMFLSGNDAFGVAYGIGENKLDISRLIKNNELNLILKTKYNNGEIDISRNYKLNITVPGTALNAISLYTDKNGAQYMEWDAYRTRLNTLFARQLIEKANNGIDAVLSPETQNLREPKPGPGTYVTLTLKPYDPAIHGSDRRFTLEQSNIFNTQPSFCTIYSGILSTVNTTVTLFIPRLESAYGVKENFYIRAKYQSGRTTEIRLECPDTSNPHGWILDTTSEVHNGTFHGLESVSGLSQPDEPMDFSGANALYFWELFYYTPMMVAMRLLQEQNFTEANRWLSYIWRPAATGTGDWRVRPLKEDTSWNADPLDSVDPDAVAQNDPMHYKVSTLMKLLDLLIARGDSAYRMLERDTLNEAKMWYMQALGLLGDKPITITGSGWGNPALSDAADQTKTKQRQDMISGVRNGGLLP
ncbi:insecticidal toxin protein, partial [Morganella morganii subsp. morganii]|nr:insecticidal toxin protein [Morganella morganii subsp. morganii]MBT0517582.1 insecticidal toxin protein [Morganella morganii subsp. morganii]